MACGATAENHCCWVGKAGVCPHFDATLEGGFCSLMAELGDWDLVHEDPRYTQRVFFENHGTSLCGDYPRGKTCATCGVSDG